MSAFAVQLLGGASSCSSQTSPKRLSRGASLGSLWYLKGCSIPHSSSLNLNLHKMVRVKNRYLVIDFLYPHSSPPTKPGEAPTLVQIHAPTPDAVQAGQFVRMVKDGIAELFGDYGMGVASTSLKGTPQTSIHQGHTKLRST
jgi:hypothetical protein